MNRTVTAVESFFVESPLWCVLLVTLVTLFAAFEGGFLIGKHRQRRKEHAKEFSVDPMVGATLGLLAFMLAFTFGTAASHFQTRRHLVLEEANIIRTAYHMTRLMADSPGAQSRELLREYVDTRTTDIKTMEELASIRRITEEIHNRLWESAVHGEAENSGAASSWLYVQTLTDMFNKQAERIHYGTHGKIAPSVWLVLYWLGILGMASMGYRSGLAGVHGDFAYLVLIVTFSLVLVLISDLDRPKQLFFRINLADFQDLKNQMATQELGCADDPER